MKRKLEYLEKLLDEKDQRNCPEDKKKRKTGLVFEGDLLPFVTENENL